METQIVMYDEIMKIFEESDNIYDAILKIYSIFSFETLKIGFYNEKLQSYEQNCNQEEKNDLYYPITTKQMKLYIRILNELKIKNFQEVFEDFKKLIFLSKGKRFVSINEMTLYNNLTTEIINKYENDIAVIVNKIKDIIYENMQLYLPHVNPNDLEENGKIYYMNGRNGTSFDWHVNERLSEFMCFYNDTSNMGAVKLYLFNDGQIELYLYDNKGRNLIEKILTNIEEPERKLLKFATVLGYYLDNKGIWDASIENINTDIEISDYEVQVFCDGRKNFEEIIESKKNDMLKKIEKENT